MPTSPSFRRRRAALAFAAAFALLPAAVQALDPVNTNWRGLAIDGYDPVAYFTDGRPVAGSSEFTHRWQDATWRFASAAHRDRFARDPAKYAPRYGGYCAWAVSQGYTADIDPDAWAIVDGRLYLNYNAEIRTRWAADRDGNIARADANWPKLLKAD